MNIDIAKQDPSRIYSIMAQTIMPRPIAWVLSEHANGSYNLSLFLTLLRSAVIRRCL